MRLIDADALAQTLGITNMNCNKCELGINGHCQRGEAFVIACMAIEEAPTMEERKKGKLKRLPSSQPEQRWIPVKLRPMDDEERKEWSEKLGYDLEDDEAVIYTSLPEDGQECIVCTKWGNVFIDTFQNDPDYGCCFEEHGDMDGITAWMPLPKPWKGERNE